MVDPLLVTMTSANEVETVKREATKIAMKFFILLVISK